MPNSPFARDIANVLHPTTDLARHAKDGSHIIVKGKGITVTDIGGRDYIEGMAGLWCAALGFGEEELVKAAADAMRDLSFYHNFGAKAVMPVIDLAEKLNSIAPFASSKAFFVNSGSEANDTQIKLARYYNNARGKPLKKKIISRHRSYHGVTLATAGLTGIPVFRDGFDVADPSILHTDCPHYYRYGEVDETEEAFADRLVRNLEQLIEREGADTIAAFIAEPVMGGGGVIVPPRTYFEKVQRVLRANDILLIADEVICGFGRTGRMFGCETFGITPDTMTLAKGLSSAHLPIAAALIPEKMYDVLIAHSERHGVFGHGYTYGGHPVCAAVALRNIQLMEERNILGHVATVAPVFQQRLKSFGDHPLIGHTRGVGLIGGLEFVADKKTKQQFPPAAGVAAYCVRRCLEHGLITRTVVGDTIAFSPPLIIQPDEVDEMFRRFGKALDETEIWVREQGLRS